MVTLAALSYCRQGESCYSLTSIQTDGCACIIGRAKHNGAVADSCPIYNCGVWGHTENGGVALRKKDLGASLEAVQGDWVGWWPQLDTC